MAISHKKRAVVSYENMSAELAAAFAEKYPKGYADYLTDLQQYPKPDGTSFYAVSVEIPDAIYLVKIKVKVDDVEDIEKWLDSENEGAEEGEETTSTPETPESLPDDNISQYGGGDDDSTEA